MAVLNLQVGAGADDAREVATVMYLDETTGIIMPASTPGAWAAARFGPVTIPVGSTITAVVLSLYVYTSANDSPDVNVFFHASDNSPQPTTTASDLSSRSVTSGVVWTDTNIGTGWKSPADLTTPFSEVYSRPGYAPNIYVTALLDARSTGNDFRFRCFENDPALAPTLVITYTAPAGGGVAVKMAHYRRLRS